MSDTSVAAEQRLRGRHQKEGREWSSWKLPLTASRRFPGILASCHDWPSLSSALSAECGNVRGRKQTPTFPH